MLSCEDDIDKSSSKSLLHPLSLGSVTGGDLADRSFVEVDSKFVVDTVFMLYDPVVASINDVIGLVPIMSIECWKSENNKLFKRICLELSYVALNSVRKKTT